jgi:hypothetical protein
MAPRLSPRWPAGGAAAVLVLSVALASVHRSRAGEAPRPPVAPPAPVIDIEQLGQNAACYVCHTTFVKEELAKVHLANKVTCVQCHGLSEKHANDENIGATKPDMLYPRAAVDGSCQKCHEDHDVPAQRVVARFLERKLPTDRAVICTECHGTHKIDRAAAKPNAADRPNIAPAATTK